MASQMEWSHEFCLSCDRQLAEGGAYCSQACRLADLEKAGTSDHQATSNLSSSASSTGSSHGFYLPPALNFTALKTPSTTSRGFDMGHSASNYYSNSNASYYTQSASSHASSQPQQRSLTPSSSRSSLASSASQTTTTSGISAQAAHQLNSYVRSFDQTRDTRRMSRRYTQY